MDTAAQSAPAADYAKANNRGWLIVLILLAAVGSYFWIQHSKREDAKRRVLDAISRIDRASDRFDLDARVRDADIVQDEVRNLLTDEQNAALSDYKSSAKYQDSGYTQQDQERSRLEHSTCRDDAYAALYGPGSSGKCRKMMDDDVQKSLGNIK